MPLFSHNQFNDMFLHIRKKLDDLNSEAERKQEKDFELERIEAGIKDLRQHLEWVLSFGEKVIKQETNKPGPGRPKKETK